MKMLDLGAVVEHAKRIYGGTPIPLHRPLFNGNEEKYLSECIKSNFVSSVGAEINKFEKAVAEYVGVKHGVAMVNGTAALQVALEAVGVRKGDLVITQGLSFVATANAITHAGAAPAFVDVDLDTVGISPSAVEEFLQQNCKIVDGKTRILKTGQRVAACVPMHTFGIPVKIKNLLKICQKWNIPIVEDAAEALGSFSQKQSIGSFGLAGVFSFNGNKIITTGGGGMLVTNSNTIAEKARHLSTTAKLPHAYHFVHDKIAYNFRMPNLNAVLGLAQMEQLESFLISKQIVAQRWQEFFLEYGYETIKPIRHDVSNNWLVGVILASQKERDELLEYTNERNVMTRPIWQLLPNLPMYKAAICCDVPNSKWLFDRVVNLPSSVPE